MKRAESKAWWVRRSWAPMRPRAGRSLSCARRILISLAPVKGTVYPRPAALQSERLDNHLPSRQQRLLELPSLAQRLRDTARLAHEAHPALAVPTHEVDHLLVRDRRHEGAA